MSKTAGNTKNKEKAFSGISLSSFITVVALLLSVMVLAGLLSYVIPQGSFEYDENGVIIQDSYQQYGVEGIAIWRIITAPVRVFASDNALTIIMISVFLLIMSGVFNLLEKTGGTKVVIGRLMRRLADKGGPVVCLCALIFMFFGSFFGMFEELVTLLPLIICFMISLGYDTMTGLGACMIAACGIIEIAKALGGEKGEYYLGEALKLLQTGEKEFVDYSQEQDALVLKGTLRYPHREEDFNGVEVPIIYADFYFLEAMLKLKGNDFLIW